jgi:hypothetical protein
MDDKMKSDRRVAIAVGVLYLAGMIFGVVGNMLVQSSLAIPDYLSSLSANGLKVAIGAMLMLMTAAWDATHGILMFPILKKHQERIAFGYLGFRIVNAVFLAIQVLFVLMQIPMGSEYLKAGGHDTYNLQSLSTLFINGNLYAYQIAMIFVGLASLMLCYSFYQTKLLPRFIAVWGLVGYATILCGSVLEVLGYGMHLIHTIPGGLWELFAGVWLIARGFNSSAISYETAHKNP